MFVSAAVVKYYYARRSGAGKSYVRTQSHIVNLYVMLCAMFMRGGLVRVKYYAQLSEKSCALKK